MTRDIFCGLSLLLALTCATWADEVPELPGPEKQHEWLRQFTGEWSTHSKAEMGPGQPAMECSGSITSRMIGGFWVVNEMKGDMAGVPMSGVQTIGYDTKRKKYIGTWIDSSCSFMWKYEGSVDAAGRVLTLEAEGPNIMAGGELTRFQDIYEFKSRNEITISSRMLSKDGKWITFLTGTATRKRPKAARDADQPTKETRS